MTDHEMLNAVFSHTNYHIYVDNEKYMKVGSSGYENFSFEFDEKGNLIEMY